jgi:hypothetical protein
VDVTKSFVNAFPYVLRAKLRGFFRRSLYRYAIAAALLAYALNIANIKAAAIIDFVRIWAIYFLGICAVALVLIVFSTRIQSRRLVPQEVTFREDAIIVTHRGQTETRTWDWIIHAEESRESFAFLVQERPRLELFLGKRHLTEDEYRSLRTWLVEHGKLLPDTRAA